jgi:hypothetical protein
MRAKVPLRREALAASPSEGGLDNTGNRANIPQSALPDSLPAAVRDRLARNNIATCEAWLALKRERFAIFGITRKTAELVDQAVAEVSR